MPYCDNCGNKVSITDKRCSKCGNKLNGPIGTGGSGGVGGGVDEVSNGIKDFFSPGNYHNIEFVLALIGVIFVVLGLPQAFNSYAFTYSGLFYTVVIALFISLVGAIVIRYYAKPGAVILLIGGFSLILFGMEGMALPLILFIIAAVIAFIR